MHAQRTWHTCTQCGVQFLRRADAIRGRPFCSTPCYRIAGPLRVSTLERFWTRVCKTDCCWLWFGAQHKSGYGKLMVGHRYRLSHQIAYELTHGAIPDDRIITHDCDVKLCVRPDHLRLGTKSSNTAEWYERRDIAPCCGGPIIWI